MSGAWYQGKTRDCSICWNKRGPSGTPSFKDRPMKKAQKMLRSERTRWDKTTGRITGSAVISQHRQRMAGEEAGARGVSGGEQAEPAGTTRLPQGVPGKGAEPGPECCFISSPLFYFRLRWEGLHVFQHLSAGYHRTEAFSSCVAQSLLFR